jgi:hypothetical protein
MPKRDPAVLVDATARRNDKIVRLPNDSARWAWVVSLGEAKLQRPPGRFPSVAAYEEALGRLRPHRRALIGVGLLEVVPDLCDRCLDRHGDDLRHGTVVVHDWRDHQFDPTNALRQAAFRERESAKSNAGRNAKGNGKSNGPSNAPSRGRTRAHVANTNTNMNLNDGSQVPTSIPAREVVAPLTSEARLTPAQVQAWEPFEHPSWQPFRLAWHERGFRDPPTEAQRGVLWPIVDARPRGVVEWVRGARKGARADQVVEHVIAQWRGLEAEVGAEEEAIEVERAERDPAPEKAATILRRLVGEPQGVGVGGDEEDVARW